MNLKEQLQKARKEFLEIKTRCDNLGVEIQNEKTTLERQEQINQELPGITKELETKRSEIENLQKKIREENQNIFSRAGGVNIHLANENEEPGMRAEDFRNRLLRNEPVNVNLRSLLLANGLSAEATQPTVNQTFSPISALYNALDKQAMIGLNTYKVAYEKAFAEGNVTAEGGTALETDPTFGDAVINKSKITTYISFSEEYEKLTAPDYQATLMRQLENGIKMKIVDEVINGDGSTDHFMGILNSATIDANSVLETATIDENTLDTIVNSYGGDENIEGMQSLIMNKATLLAFASVRGTQDKKSVYNIDYINKTINGIPYYITSKIKSSTTALAGETYLLYGALNAYTMAIFNDIEVTRDPYTRLKDGYINYRGMFMGGGNVTKYNAFLKINKPTA